MPSLPGTRKGAFVAEARSAVTGADGLVEETAAVSAVGAIAAGPVRAVAWMTGVAGSGVAGLAAQATTRVGRSSVRSCRTVLRLVPKFRVPPLVE
jgi:hypothetical protein